MEEFKNDDQPSLIYPLLYPIPSAPAPEDSIYFAQTNLGNESPIQTIPFAIEEPAAQEKYINWINSLWFTPTGFKKQASVPPFRKIYVPFYQISTCVTSDFKAQYMHKRMNPTNHSEEIYWKDGTGTYTETYDKVVFCGDSGEYRDLFTLVFGSSLSTAKPPQGTQLNTENQIPEIKSIYPSILASSLHEVRPAMTEQEIWSRYAEPKFVHEQKIKCEEKLKLDFPGLGYRDIEIHSQFSQIKYNVIYVPGYIGSYPYMNEHYVFIVNGHNAMYDGQRPPYGLGKIGDLKKGVGNFVGTIMHSFDNDIGVIHGSQLASQDEVQVYQKHHFYITFPRSNSYLITESVGFVTLRNKGMYNIELLAQKRRGVQKGATWTLGAGIQQTFTYKGHWCIEIVQGDAADVEIVEVSTYGGQNKGENRLGMA